MLLWHEVDIFMATPEQQNKNNNKAINKIKRTAYVFFQKVIELCLSDIFYSRGKIKCLSSFENDVQHQLIYFISGRRMFFWEWR